MARIQARNNFKGGVPALNHWPKGLSNIPAGKTSSNPQEKSLIINLTGSGLEWSWR